MKILVTDGTGFIGNCFIRHILKKYNNYKVINLDTLTFCGNIENIKDVKNKEYYNYVRKLAQ